MPTVVRVSPCVEATQALGAGLAHLLRPGDVVALRGELGAGKTALVRGIAGGLGIGPGLVSSPTFVVINQYPVPSPGRGGLRMLVHVDAYRVTEIGELDNTGWDRLFDAATGRAAPGHAAVIEWSERIQAALPAEHAAVTLTHEGEEVRRITLDLPDSWASRPDADLLLQRPPCTCPVTGRWTSPTSPTYPFIDVRARDADLYQWIVPRDED